MLPADRKFRIFLKAANIVLYLSLAALAETLIFLFFIGGYGEWGMLLIYFLPPFILLDIPGLLFPIIILATMSEYLGMTWSENSEIVRPFQTTILALVISFCNILILIMMVIIGPH